MTRCCICGGPLFPPWNWREEWCQGCAVNFVGSQELRVHEGTPLPERQRTALERLATAHARDVEHQVYVQACLEREARRSRMAQEDGHG
jgi:hypothetical protein